MQKSNIMHQILYHMWIQMLHILLQIHAKVELLVSITVAINQHQNADQIHQLIDPYILNVNF